MAETTSIPTPEIQLPTETPAAVEAPFNDAFAAIDKIANEVQPTIEAPKKQDAPKPTTAPKETTKSTEKPAAEKTEIKPTKPDAPKQPEKAASLRENYDKVKAEVKDWERKYQELEKKHLTPQEDEEKKRLLEERDGWSKQKQELESELKFAKYERSNEFKEKYQKPFIDAYESGKKKAASMKTAQKEDANTGQVIPSRQGTPEDFDALMAITDDDAAAEFANERFGTKAPSLLYHREKVLELHAARNGAIEEYRQKGEAREREQMENQTKQQKQMGEKWEKLNQAAAEKYPNWFKPTEGDDKGNELLKKGFELASMAFSNNSNLPPEKLMEIHSATFNKAAAFDRQVYLNAQMRKELTELKTKLAEFEESEPQRGQERKEAAAGGKQRETIDEALERLAVPV